MKIRNVLLLGKPGTTVIEIHNNFEGFGYITQLKSDLGSYIVRFSTNNKYVAYSWNGPEYNVDYDYNHIGTDKISEDADVKRKAYLIQALVLAIDEFYLGSLLSLDEFRNVHTATFVLCAGYLKDRSNKNTAERTEKFASLGASDKAEVLKQSPNFVDYLEDTVTETATHVAGQLQLDYKNLMPIAKQGVLADLSTPRKLGEVSLAKLRELAVEFRKGLDSVKPTAEVEELAKNYLSNSSDSEGNFEDARFSMSGTNNRVFTPRKLAHQTNIRLKMISRVRH